MTPPGNPRPLRAHPYGMSLPRPVVALVVGGLLASSGGCGPAPPPTGIPPGVRATAWTTALDNGEAHPRGAMAWVRTTFPALGRLAGFGYQGRPYPVFVIELWGHWTTVPTFGGPYHCTVLTVAVPVNRHHTDRSSLISFSTCRKRPFPLARLGTVHHAAIPGVPVVRAGVVPGVLDLDVRTASAAIRRAGFRVTVRHRADAYLPGGTVVAERPDPGTRPRRRTVVLFVTP